MRIDQTSDRAREPGSDKDVFSPRSATRRVFIFTLFVFCVSPVSVLSDGQYSLVLSDSIIHHHSSHLNSYRFPSPIPRDAHCGTPSERDSHASDEYQLDRIGNNVVYCYPNGSSILSVPFVALAGLASLHPASADGRYNYVGEARIQNLLAAILMALFSCIVFRTSLLLLNTPSSLLIAFGTAFGTQVWSTASRTLWSHTWLILLAGCVIYLILRCERRRVSLHPTLLATLLSWMYFVRPTGAVPIICLTIYVLARHRREFALFAAVGASWFIAFIVYCWFTFGRPIPEYYLNFHNKWLQVPMGLTGVLVSPSRGLFVFVPITVFVIYLALRYWRRLPFRGLALVAFGTIGIQTALISSWHFWWGGYAYGPRYLTDLVPWFALLAILALAGRSERPQAPAHRLEATIGLILLAISVVINGRGAMSWATFRWNNAVDIDFHPERAFDWRYPQFMAGLVAAPKYAKTDAGFRGRLGSR